jgi:LysM repeat protein
MSSEIDLKSEHLFPAYEDSPLDSMDSVDPSPSLMNHEQEGTSPVGSVSSSTCMPPSLSREKSSRSSHLTFYIVQPQETLQILAARFGISVPTLSWLNHLSDRSLLHCGDVSRRSMK